MNLLSKLKIPLTVVASLACLTVVAANDAIIPSPRTSPRFDWQARHQGFVKRAQQGNIDLLFLGDSITDHWREQPLWAKLYGHLKAENFGIGGDRTEHLLWRIENGELSGLNPKMVVLLIGTNNLPVNTVPEIIEGITVVVRSIQKKLPNSKILLLGVFPRDAQPNTPFRNKIREINAAISTLDNDGSPIEFLDFGERFLNSDGTISTEIMPDSLHLSGKGYRIWANAIQGALIKVGVIPRPSK